MTQTKYLLNQDAWIGVFDFFELPDLYTMSQVNKYFAWLVTCDDLYAKFCSQYDVIVASEFFENIKYFLSLRFVKTQGMYVHVNENRTIASREAHTDHNVMWCTVQCAQKLVPGSSYTIAFKILSLFDNNNQWSIVCGVVPAHFEETGVVGCPADGGYGLGLFQGELLQHDSHVPRKTNHKVLEYEVVSLELDWEDVQPKLSFFVNEEFIGHININAAPAEYYFAVSMMRGNVVQMVPFFSS